MVNCRLIFGMISMLALCSQPPSRASGQGLHGLYRLQDSVSETHMEYHEVKLPAGKEVVLGDLKGPGKITYWYITDGSHGKFYAGLVLKIFWDDEAEPSIHVPLSDFFGAMGGHTIDYQSAPMQIEHFCYMCYLPMPFSQHARFVLANDGDKDYRQSMAWGIDYEQGQQFAREKSRLCCAWRRSNPDPRGPAHDPGRPRPRPLRGELLAGLHQVRRLVGRGRHDLPPRRQEDHAHARHGRRVWRLLGLRQYVLLSFTAATCKTTRATTACTAGTCPIPCDSGSR